jgi:predicted nuclease of predicted toxin-antitoxin system
MKFLVDECLSPELVKLAHHRGHGESSHVVWRNLQGKKDWELKPFILDGDWTFATRNSVDFVDLYPVRDREDNTPEW